MITQRAVIIGFIGACFYIIALVNNLPSYYSILTWLAVTVLVSCAGVAALSLQGVSCSWSVLRSRSSAVSLAEETEDDESHDRVLNSGDESGPVLQIELRNKGTLNKTGMLVDVRVRHLGRNQDITRVFMVESLPSGTSVASTLTLRGLPRGRYEVSEITLIGSDVLGLFRSRMRVYRSGLEKSRTVKAAVSTKPPSLRFYLALGFLGGAAVFVGLIAQRLTVFGGVAALAGGVLSILVSLAGILSWWRATSQKRLSSQVAPSPNAEHVLLVGPVTVATGRVPEAAASSARGEENNGADSLGVGDEVRGTRPYIAGDDLRTVHWKSTARLGQLVVKEFHRPARSECLVIWDGAAPTTENIEYSRDVEFGLSLVASLCRAWVDRGLPCTLLQMDASPHRVQSRQSASGTAPLSAFIEVLAQAEALRTTSLFLCCGHAVEWYSRVTVMFISSPHRQIRHLQTSRRPVCPKI
jgi:uncharacterized protein (DUF58 family)